MTSKQKIKRTYLRKFCDCKKGNHYVIKVTWTKWQGALTFITTLKEIMQNRMTINIFFKRYSKKKQQILENVNHDRV